MALTGPVTGDFECTGINLTGMAGALPAQGGDVQVSFAAQDGSTLRGSVTFTTDIETGKTFEVGNIYSFTAAEAPTGTATKKS